MTFGYGTRELIPGRKKPTYREFLAMVLHLLQLGIKVIGEQDIMEVFVTVIFTNTILLQIPGLKKQTSEVVYVKEWPCSPLAVKDILHVDMTLPITMTFGNTIPEIIAGHKNKIFPERQGSGPPGSLSGTKVMLALEMTGPIRMTGTNMIRTSHSY